MSINVTVSGNPVHISRSKMVTAMDPLKSEFEKRRLMRLEQVRHQSKNIAESIRNKYKNAKNKRLSQVEKDGEVELKKWQACRLLELQDQYQEALNDIGLGHKQAAEEREEEELLMKQRKENDVIASERGRVAAQQLQVEKNEENLKRAMPVQRKKLVRDTENSRASAVSQGERLKAPNKRTKLDEIIDSDEENRVPQLHGLDSERDSSIRLESRKVNTTAKEQQTTHSLLHCGVPTNETAAQTVPTAELVEENLQFSADKRITERIRSRLSQNTNYCEKLVDCNTRNCCCCKCPTQVDRPECYAGNTLSNPNNDEATRINGNKNVPLMNRYLIESHADEINDINSNNPGAMRRPASKNITGPDLNRYSVESHEDESNDKNLNNHGATHRHGSKNINRRERNRYSIESNEEEINLDREAAEARSRHNPLKEPGDIIDRRLKPTSRIETDAVLKTAPKKPSQLITTSERQNIHEAEKIPEGKSTNPTKSRVSQSVREPVKVPTKTVASQPNKAKQQIRDNKVNSRKAPPAVIPTTGKVTLRSVKQPSSGPSSTHPVKYYDYGKRQSKEYFPDKSLVHKISDEDIVISPVVSEAGLEKKMRQRDIEAHIRGQVALEKNRIQREYNELLSKLPALQKQERIYEIGTDKEKYHMSRDRLLDLERRRQNRLDNAYEEIFVRQKPAIVTLPRQNTEEGPRRAVNPAWDEDFEPEGPGNTRNEQLSTLLDSLKTQKQHLLREIEKTLASEPLEAAKATKYSESNRKRTGASRLPSASSSEEFETDLTRKGSRRSGASTTTIPSPRKKMKSSRKRLILQNTSTQTTPKAEKSASTSPIPKAAPPPELCACAREPGLDEMCEIVIKIKEDEKPEVTVMPPVHGKNVKIITDSSPVGKIEESNAPPPKPKKVLVRESKPTKRAKSASWGESLTQTSSSSTSTSYLEPPNVTKVSRDDDSRSRNSTRSELDGSRKLDPRLLVYIKKLLNMSRASIDDLSASASEVSTPGTSIVGTPANNPLQQLLSVMKYFNLDAAEVSKQLSYLSDEHSLHYNSSKSVTINSESEGGTTLEFKSCSEVDDGTTKRVQESSKKTVQYADIAASCTQKISDLTAKIAKVRAEKQQILKSPPTSGDDLTKTSYLQLPNQKDETSSTVSEDPVLNIDYNYADKLKQLSSEEFEAEKTRVQNVISTDQELLTRLKDLLSQNNVDRKRDEAVLSHSSTLTLRTNSPEASGSLFLDIPKLPRLEPVDEKKKKKPPPSKGLRSLAVLQAPHELSTIIEADSQLSNKDESPSKQNPKKSEQRKEHSSPSTELSELETMETMLAGIGMEWAIPTLRKTRETLAIVSTSSGSKDSGDVSLREFLSKISSSSESLLSDSQGISLIQVDNRRTSTPIVAKPDVRKSAEAVFPSDSDLSSVRDQSDGTKFFDLNEESDSKTR